MDDMEKDLPEFSLEDILKEFGSFDDQQDQPLADVDVDEDVLIWDGNPPEKSAEAAPVQDTVRLDEITRAVRKAEEVSDETVRFTPAGGEEPEPEYQPPEIPAQEEKTEPYSQEWEPEYEQPIGEYIPPQPIVFRPKSRLRELKRKLVEGPEKRYYELLEQGKGKLQTAIFLNLIVALLTVGTTAMDALGMVGDDRIRLLVYGQFLFFMLSALLGSYQLLEGLTDLLHGRFSLNTLLLVSFIACCADSVICLQNEILPCCGAFSLSMTMSLWSAYQKRNTELSQMDTMRKATQLDSVVKCPDYYEGRPGFLRSQGQVEDFMDTYNVPAGVEKTLRIYALIALFVSLGIGIAAGVSKEMSAGIRAFCVSLLVSVPATSFITLSRPMALLQRRLHKLGTVLCGWQGVKELSSAGVFPITDTDLFPIGSAKMNGVKFYGSRDPDEVVAYGAALVTAAGGSMAPLFAQLLESRNGYHYEAENLRSYDGGIGCVVNDEAVLAGTLSFMQSMGVEIPKGTRVNQAVYVAIDGTLSGVFAVTYSKVKTSAAGITTLCAYHKLMPVMTVGDFILTESFLRSKFGINTRKIVFPDAEARAELAEKLPQDDAPALALMTADGLAGAAYAVTGARALRTASVAGVVIHMIGGILGLLIMLALTVVGAEDLLTPMNILLYEFVWMVPGLLITEWTRSV